MKHGAQSRVLALTVAFLLLVLAACSGTTAGDQSDVLTLSTERAGYDKQEGVMTTLEATTTDLNTLTPDDLAAALAGTGVTIVSATYTGSNVAAGTLSLSDIDDVLGFSTGIMLSSGRIADVKGPNVSDSTSFGNGGGSDPDLAALVPGITLTDASVLVIEFVPTGSEIYFEYVFGSEEYNEFVGSEFNDVFGFFVNGVNYALVNGDPVSINTVNLGSNTAFYRNNDRSDFGGSPPIYTEMDGLTTVLTLTAPVKAGDTNTLKLAIADAVDSGYDSYVFIRGGTFSTEPPTQVNQPPSASAGGPYAGTEGSPIALSGAASDADGDPLTHTWTYVADAAVDAGATCVFSDASTLDPTFTCTDDGDFTVTLVANDGTVDSTPSSATVTISNVAPSVGAITPSTSDPVAVNTSVSISASYVDPGSNDTHTASVDWGDGTTAAGIASAGLARADHVYTAAGVYTVELTVTDDDDGSGSASYQYIVVYDPNAGFVTGGGWIDSPAGAYPADPSLSGKANFGFVSRYQKGKTTPRGQTQFQFHAAGFNFHSTAYQWLVISGPKAQYKGTGTVNGAGAYGFILTANDGAVNGGGGVDRFRLKVWDVATDQIVYDNQMGDALDRNATDAIGGGSIVIHSK